MLDRANWVDPDDLLLPSGVQQVNTTMPVMFCVALRPRPKRSQELLEGEGAKAFACVNDISLGIDGIRVQHGSRY